MKCFMHFFVHSIKQKLLKRKKLRQVKKKKPRKVCYTHNTIINHYTSSSFFLCPDKTDELTEESVSGDEAPFKMLNVTAQLKSIEIQLYLSEVLIHSTISDTQM